MTDRTDPPSVARTFASANPVEFDLHNFDDERVLYINGDDRRLQTLILQLRNDSPQDIALATPDSASRPLDAGHEAYAWDRWRASAELFHFQLAFRPGVLSDATTRYLAHPAHRLAALDGGWELNHSTDAGDLSDRISLLWLGPEVAKQRAAVVRSTDGPKFPELDAELAFAREQLQAIAPEARATDALPRRAARQLLLSRLSAAAGGPGGGTRVQLRYANLIYANDGTWVPRGNRTLYINTVNHQGRKDIPLHVGFAGSNTVLNDGVTANELELRITNVSATDVVTFKALPATTFTLSFDTDDQPWALTQVSEAENFGIEWDGSAQFTAKAAKTAGAPAAPPAADAHWHPSVAFQGERLVWRFRYVGRADRELQPGQSLSMRLSNIRSSAPSGSTNLYLQYANVAGYWDGRYTCLIEKAPLVYRKSDSGRGDVRIGTDTGAGPTADAPSPKLTVDVGADNAGAANHKPAAVFQGGNVGVGIYPSTQAQLHVREGPGMAAALFDGAVAIQRMDTLDRTALIVGSNAASVATGTFLNTGTGAGLKVNGGHFGVVVETQGAHLQFSRGEAATPKWTVAVGADGWFRVSTLVAGTVSEFDATMAISADGTVYTKGRINDTTGEVMPVGTILPYAGDYERPGWFLCRGDAKSARGFPALFEMIGYRFGKRSGNGEDLFLLPDLRGRFLRGVDAGAGRDPEARVRIANSSEGYPSDAVGSVQNDCFKAHRHSLYGPTLSGNRSDRTGSGGNAGVAVGAVESIAYAGDLYPDKENYGLETRPKNLYVNFIIKY